MSKVSPADVIATIENALEIESGLLTEISCADDFDKWDSLGLLGMLVALDKLFDGKVAAITEMSGADSIPKIFSALRKHSLID